MQMQKKRSLLKTLGLWIIIIGLGTGSLVYAPVTAQDLLEEPDIETPEPEAEPDNPTGLQTPVVDISTATTTENVEIPPEELALLLKPMTIGKITGRYIKIYSF